MYRLCYNTEIEPLMSGRAINFIDIVFESISILITCVTDEYAQSI